MQNKIMKALLFTQRFFDIEKKNNKAYHIISINLTRMGYHVIIINELIKNALNRAKGEY